MAPSSQYSTQGESPPTLPREHQHNGQRHHARPKGPGRRHLRFVCSLHTDVSLASGFREFERKRKREVISESLLSTYPAGSRFARPAVAVPGSGYTAGQAALNLVLKSHSGGT